MTPDLPPALDHTRDRLPYEALLERRELASIDLLVIHCTETPDLASARRFGETVLYDSGTGNSGHYYIDRDGSLHLWVSPDRVAHHVRGYNPRSIGIELVNRGRYPNWLHADHQAMDEPYTDAQIRTLGALVAHLEASLPALALIAGHEDLDTTRVTSSDDATREVARKRDPGPLFPWEAVLDGTRLERLQPGAPTPD